MSSPPQWLQDFANNHAHIKLVLRTLHARENERTKARALSYHAVTNTSQPKQSDCSRTDRLLNRFRRLSNGVDPVVFKEKYSVSIGTHPDNSTRNRYLDVEPYDATRVVCNGQICTDDPPGASSFYVNASWVRERAGGRWWIASQAALPNTAYDFLSLIMQPQTIPPTGPATGHVRTVVQLTQAVEGGRRKADAYFPNQVGQSTIICSDSMNTSSSLKVSLQRQEKIDNGFVKSTVSISPLSHPNSEPVIFHHLLYPSWPDHGIPEPKDRDSLLSFLRLVEETNEVASESLSPPIIVGCSAGIGRTGAYIALTSLLRFYGLLSSPSTPHPPLPDSPLGPLPASLQDDLVALEIDSLREQRPGMVQRDEQALLVYELLSAAFSSGQA